MFERLSVITSSVETERHAGSDFTGWSLHVGAVALELGADGRLDDHGDWGSDDEFDGSIAFGDGGKGEKNEDGEEGVSHFGKGAGG